MAKLTPEQRAIAQQILRAGKSTGLASPKIDKAAIETARVESNISNPHYGDADSEGWRQERKSLYPNPTNVSDAAKRFYREAAAVKDKYGTAGELAAAVQRPAAQYQGRYQQVAGEADAILKELGGSPLATVAKKTVSAKKASTKLDQREQQDAPQRLAILAALVKKHHPDSLLLKSGLLS